MAYQITKSGKYLFAAAMLGFGAIQFVTGNLPSEFMPLPADMPGKSALAYGSGAVLVLAALGIILNRKAALAAVSIGVFFLFFLLLLHAPNLVSDVRNPAHWVTFLETLAFCSGAFILVDAMPVSPVFLEKWGSVIHLFAVVGRYTFAAAMLVFGIQHFMYEKFILTLIPAWIPAKLFWSYLVKAAFIGTAISIFVRIKAKLAAFWLGIMFLTWA